MFLVSAFRIPLSVHHMVADTTTPTNRRRGDRMKVKFTYRRGDDELVQGCRLKMGSLHMIPSAHTHTQKERIQFLITCQNRS